MQADSAAGLLLVGVPLATFFFLKVARSPWKWAASGFAFGAIVCPWSMALYGLYFSSVWGLIPGLLGLVSSLLHGSVPYELAIGLGVVAPNTVVSDEQRPVLALIGALFWAPAYGFIGALIDYRQKTRRVGTPPDGGIR